MRRVVAVLFALVSVGAACAGEAPEVPVGPDGEPDPVLVTGRDIFSSRCANCHGTSGGGGQGPRLADGRVVENYPEIDEQIAVVANGRNQMPAFEGTLTPAEIEAVVRYTREVL